MKIAEILSPKAVKASLVATDKKSAIYELVDLLAAAGLVSDAEAFKEVVWKREQQRTTGIGEGLAIPHGRSAATKDLALAIGRPKEPIDFAAVDRKPVRLIALLASPQDKTGDHIQALGKISRLWVNVDFREATSRAGSSEELFRLFRDADQ